MSAASHARIELIASPPCEAFRPRFNLAKANAFRPGGARPGTAVHAGSKASIIAFIAGASLIGFATNLTMHLLNLRMQSLGASGMGIGLSVAIQALGIVLAAPLTKPAIGLFGVRQTLMAGALLCCATLAGFGLVTNPFLWNAMRFVFAVGLALLFTASEFLIISRADGSNRGSVVGWYATALAMGTSAGPLLITVIGIQGAAPLLWGALIFGLSTTPIIAYLRPGEELAPVVRASTFATLRIAPIAFLSAFVFGLADNGGMALLAVYSILSGYDYQSAVTLAVFATVGAISLQMPIGYLASTRNPRVLLVYCSVASTCVLTLLPNIMAAKPAAYAAVFVLGGLLEGLYTIGLICIAKHYRGLGISAANGCFVSLCGFGELVGPLATGASMQYLGASGFVLALTMALAAYGVLIVSVRNARRPAARADAPAPAPA